MANADFDQIPSNVSFGASQSVRRNSGNSAFELFTATADGLLPSQSGNSGKFLSTNGSAVSWASVASGITIGTTPISSGTNNRVLFQSSGVVSQGNLEFSGSELKVLNGSNTNGVSVDGSGYGYFSPSGNRSRFQTYPNPLYVEIYGDGVTGRAYINNTHGSRIVFPVEIGVDAGLAFGTAGQTINFNGGLLTSAYSVSAGYLIANGDISVIGASAYQARFGYDVSNYFNISVGASGGVTFDAIGSGAKFAFSDNVEIADGKNLIFGTSTGTKIGTGSTEKIAFWGGTPVTQRTIFGGITDATGGTSGTTINIDDGMGGIDVSALNDALATIINRLNATRNILLDVGIAA